MANDASCLLHLDPSQLLAHFENKYPQTRSWLFVNLRSEMLSSAVSVLDSARPGIALLLQALPPPTKLGKYGNNSALTSEWTPNSTKSMNPSFCYRFLRTSIA
jgi:hypothetical protein